MNKITLYQLIEQIVSTKPDDKTLLVNNMIEKMTGCTIYNKKEILKRCVDMNNNTFIQEVCKNIHTELDFDKFKELGFSIIFVNDDVRVLYNNTIVDSSIVDTINIVDKPQFPELYIMNLKDIINKFNNIDISIIYNCLNINMIYLNLFRIKAKKKYNDTQAHLNASKHIRDIISGDIYKDTDEMKDIIMIEDQHKDSDNKPYDINNEVFRLETLSYMNDNQVNEFLNIDEIVTQEERKLDYNNEVSVVNYIKKLLDINSYNNMGLLFKIYFINKMFKCLLNATNFLACTLGFMTTVKNKIKQFESEKSIIKIVESNLTKDFIKTLEKTKELIASIEKNS